jgi:hypothetical protein
MSVVLNVQYEKGQAITYGMGLGREVSIKGMMSVVGTEGKKSLLCTQRKHSGMVLFHSLTKGPLPTRGAPHV